MVPNEDKNVSASDKVDDISTDATPEASDTDQSTADTISVEADEASENSSTSDTQPVPPASESEIEPPTQGTSASPAFSSQPATASQPKKGKKKGLIIGIISAAVIVLLMGGSALAYSLWYQNPDKVVSDAMINYLRAKTIIGTDTITYTLKEGSLIPSMKVTVKMNTKNRDMTGVSDVAVSVESGAATFNGSGSAMVDDDLNVYFKINDLEKALNTFGASDAAPASVKALVKKIDGKWIKISPSDFAESSPELEKAWTCVADTYKRLKNDKEAGKELAALYSKNQFVVVKDKVANKGGSLGYLLDFDKEKAKGFVRGLEGTIIMKELEKCTPNGEKFDGTKVSNDIFKSDALGDQDIKMETKVWIDQFSHQLTHYETTQKSSALEATQSGDVQVNAPVTIETPKDAMPLKDLQAEIEKIQQETTLGSPSLGTGTIEQSLRETCTNTYRSNNRGQAPTDAQVNACIKSYQQQFST